MCEDSEDSLMEEDESEWDADAPPVDQTAARAAAKAAAEKALPECKIDALQKARAMTGRALLVMSHTCNRQELSADVGNERGSEPRMPPLRWGVRHHLHRGGWDGKGERLQPRDTAMPTAWKESHTQLVEVRTSSSSLPELE